MLSTDLKNLELKRAIQYGLAIILNLIIIELNRFYYYRAYLIEIMYDTINISLHNLITDYAMKPKAIAEALEAMELIKINVLQNCADDPKEIAQIVAERTHSQVVQVIGKKIVLYKESKDNKKIELPKDNKKK